MKFQAELDRLNTLKDGMKVVLYIDGENVKEVMKNIYNFMDKPLEVDLSVNRKEQEERLAMISGGQRKKIYALFRDIGEFVGETAESMKVQLKQEFCRNTEHEDFSLSDCSKELASDFIEWLVEFAIKQGADFSEEPKQILDDLESYTHVCLSQKVCVVCGKMAEIHHFQAIGMGRNRNTVDDSTSLVIPLCRSHHSEAHSIGRDSFCEKYHIKPARRR